MFHEFSISICLNIFIVSSYYVYVLVPHQEIYNGYFITIYVHGLLNVFVR